MYVLSYLSHSFAGLAPLVFDSQDCRIRAVRVIPGYETSRIGQDLVPLTLPIIPSFLPHKETCDTQEVLNFCETWG